MEKDLVKHEDVIEYVRNVQKGETNCYNILLEKCGQIITYTLKKYLNLLRKYDVDVDDFKQHLHLCFFECIKKFPNEHKNFIAYAFVYLNQRTLQFLHQYNKISEDEKEVHLNAMTFNNEDMELIDIIEDEKTKYCYNDIEDKIIRENSSKNIRKILNKFISNNDIDLLFDIYGINGIKNIKQISKEYNKSINDIIRWERLIILTLQTNSKLHQYHDELMCNVSYYYSYNVNSFRYCHTLVTKHIDIKNIFIDNKFEELKERVPINMPTLHKNIANATQDTTLVRITPNWNK